MADYLVDGNNSLNIQQKSGIRKGRPILARPPPTCQVQEYIGGLPLTHELDEGFFKSKNAPSLFSENVEDRFWRGEEAEMKVGLEPEVKNHQHSQQLTYLQQQEKQQQQQDQKLQQQQQQQYLILTKEQYQQLLLQQQYQQHLLQQQYQQLLLQQQYQQEQQIQQQRYCQQLQHQQEIYHQQSQLHHQPLQQQQQEQHPVLISDCKPLHHCNDEQPKKVDTKYTEQDFTNFFGYDTHGIWGSV